jgi:hypothetical protein
MAVTARAANKNVFMGLSGISPSAPAALRLRSR